MSRLLIIGGSDAGISAALRAREVNPKVDVTVVVADSFPNYSICGLPFYLSGEVPDWHNLAHRTAEEIAGEGIELLLDRTAQIIEPTNKIVTAVDRQGRSHSLKYDRLVVATGAASTQPRSIEGLDLPGVYLLHSMADSFAIHQHLTTHAPESAVIVGGGYIDLEMADALTHRGISVTVVQHSESVMKTLDPSLSEIVSEELQRHNVEVVTGLAIETIEQQGTQLLVKGEGFQTTTDMVVVAVGVKPAADLAQTAGVATGIKGAIKVNLRLETDVPDIYAAGDCVETWHRLLKKYTYLPLGTTAHKQGRIAGENAVGGNREFAGSLGTQVVKVFELAIARTGLRDSEAADAGFDPFTVAFETWDHKAYYPGAHKLYMRITGDRQTNRLLGAQIVGHHQAEIAKRIDIFATALFHNMKIDQLNDLDLSYAPPFSSPWDPIQMGAQAWVKSQQQSDRPIPVHA
ncbi:FAD-dependent oxidoreductase [Chroococcidiopsis sp. CCMEE 29]|uniref:FAD-dependent oxidoreductase n=1 Tax=Chroococcidiopsis sp. CCMEE 29 TaxID=155894 RepID=UPI0020224F91|nr:FAD-dependent oxidoreductase [Chroococcidiopsis sp. CCMEE 29]